MYSRIVVDGRLALEPIGPEHVAAGTALIARSRAELIPWMPWAAESDEGAYRAFVARVLSERRRGTRTVGAVYEVHAPA